ncbi:MAG TPA: hypothetical protein VIW45_09595 [Vicinamibacterales bacterium]|jgi:hypothetical protein
MRLALAALLSVALGAQGAPFEMPPRQHPDLREIGAFYFETPNESQIWINVEPASDESGPRPITINVTTKFAGTRVDGPPATAEVRAQVLCFPVVHPERVRVPILVFSIDGAKVDLSPDGVRAAQFVPSCTGYRRDGRFTLDTVVARVPFELVRRLAGAKAVDVDAIGFTVHFGPDDFGALQSFVRAVEHGVALKR